MTPTATEERWATPLQPPQMAPVVTATSTAASASASPQRRRFGHEDTSFLDSDGKSRHASCVGLTMLGLAGVRHVSDLLRSPDTGASLQLMVQLLFYNSDLPHNMTAYLASPDAEHGFYWDGAAWRREPKMTLATRVARRAADVLYGLRHLYFYVTDDVSYFRNNAYADVHDTPPSLVRRIDTIDTMADFSPLVARHHRIPAA